MKLTTTDESWIVVTFSSGKTWNKAIRRNQKMLEKKLNYNLIYAPYDEKFLKETKYWQQIERFTSENSNGFGLWIWKPLILLDALSKYHFAQGAIYIDAGCEINLNKKSSKRLEYYKKMATENNFLTFELDHLEHDYTNHNVIANFLPNLPNNSKQICATTFLIANSSYATNFLITWYDKMKENNFYNLKPSNNYDTDSLELKHINHRHDQSVFSLLLKSENISPIKDETYWAPNWKKSGLEFPIWATRNRRGYSVKIFPKLQIFLKYLARKFKFAKSFLK
jgi:hypothetical protein